MLARAGVTSQDLTEGGSSSKHICVLAGRTQVLYRLSARGSLLAIGWKPPLVPCQMGLSNMASCKASKRESQLARWKSQSYNLVTEVIFHHFCCILFLRSKSLDPAQRGLHKGMTTRRWGSLRVTLEVCLPH